jgi:hypothetical protein
MAEKKYHLDAQKNPIAYPPTASPAIHLLPLGGIV